MKTGFKYCTVIISFAKSEKDTFAMKSEFTRFKYATPN